MRKALLLVLLSSTVWPVGITLGVDSDGDDKKVAEIASRRELFVDDYLIERLENVSLELHHPRDEGLVVRFDRPWEGPFSGHFSVIKDADKYRLYYRGLPKVSHDPRFKTTCYAESNDGTHWTKPNLRLHEIQGTLDNNVILIGDDGTQSFAPFLDSRPGVPKAERFKSLGVRLKNQDGSRLWLVAMASPDGIHWSKMRDEPVMSHEAADYAFDSHNVSFWSISEQCYIAYFRTWEKVNGKRKIRRVSRATSRDYLSWSPWQQMEYRHRGVPAPVEQIYTNQTQPYFRAPHIYLAIGARFMPGRNALTTKEAQSLGLNPAYFRDTSDAILMSSRGGNYYDRTFLESFIRPGIGLGNWASRSNYPALNVVQTGPAEMSFYVPKEYAQPTIHLRRYSLRLDGFISVRAGYTGGEMVTKPLSFNGRELVINYSTSAAGDLRVEIQDAAGTPIPGYRLSECQEVIGDEIERVVKWKGGSDISHLAGKPVRLRFVMKDTNLYSLRVRP